MQIIGVFLTIFGLLMFSEKFIGWFVGIRNTMMGVKTNITKGTVLAYRISALVFIVLGLLVALGVL